MTVYSQDSFTDTNAVELENHTPDVGANWSILTDPTQWTIQDNELSRTENTIRHATVEIGQTDMHVRATFTDIQNLVALTARWEDPANYWEMFYDIGGSGWQLNKVVDSVDIPIGALMPGDVGTVHLICAGSRITAIGPDGTMRVTTDTDLGTNTQAGLILDGYLGVPSTVDDWLVTDVGLEYYNLMVNISSNVLANYQGGGSTAELRCYLSDDIVPYGTTVPVMGGGRIDSGNFFQSYTCTVSGTDLTYPTITVPATTNSSVPLSRISFVLYDADGTEVKRLGDFMIPDTPTDTTLANIIDYNRSTTPSNGTNVYTADAFERRLDDLDTAPDAETNVKGKVYLTKASGGTPKAVSWNDWAGASNQGVTALSVAPSSASSPIAVGDNDTRVAVASTSNKGITRLSKAPASASQPIAVGANDWAATGTAGITKLTVAPTVAATPIAVGANDYATNNNKGIIKLSVAAASATEPIAVGDNDPRIQPATTSQYGAGKPDTTPAGDTIYVGTNSAQILKNAKVLGTDYTDLADAEGTILTTLTQLKVVADETLSDDLDLSTNGGIILDFQGGVITVALGKTLIVDKMLDPGNKRCFNLAGASSRVLFTAGAVEKINMAWFYGATPALCTDGINNALASISANSGGTIYFPGIGSWTTAGNHSTVAGLQLVGDGGSIKATTGCNNLPIFKQTAGVYGIKLENLVINGDNGTTTGVSGYRWTGTGSDAVGHTTFQNVRWRKCAKHIDIYDTAGANFQAMALNFESCWVEVGSGEVGFWCNSGNNVLNFSGKIDVAPGGKAGLVTGAGQWRFHGIEFAGYPQTDGENQVISNTIVGTCSSPGTAYATVNAAGILAAAQTSGTLVPGRAYEIMNYVAPDDFSNVDGTPLTGVGTANTTGCVFVATETTPTSWAVPGSELKEVALISVPLTTTQDSAAKVTTEFRKALSGNPSVSSFFHIGGTDATLYFTNDDLTLIALDPAANDSTMNLAIFGNGTGVSNSFTSTAAVPGVAATLSPQGFLIDGAHGNIHFDNVITEGFSDFIIVGTSSDLDSHLTFTGCSIQNNIRLNYARTLCMTGGTISDRKIRGGEGNPTVTIIGTKMPNITYFKGLDDFVPLTATSHTNFGGTTYGGNTGIVALSVNPDVIRPLVTNNTFRAVFTEDQYFVDNLRAPLECGYSGLAAGPSGIRPMLFIGSFTDANEPQFGFLHRRDISDGRLKITCNQPALGVDYTNMDVTATGLTLTGSGLTVNGVGLDAASAETILVAGALSVTKTVSKLAFTAAGGAVTLDVPAAAMLGQTKIIEMTADTGDVTLALTNVEGQTSGTTATFNDVGDKLILIAGASKWTVLKEIGVTLS